MDGFVRRRLSLHRKHQLTHILLPGTAEAQKASSSGVSVLRRAKANSGTMLELDVREVKFDLQYCPATSITKR